MSNPVSPSPPSTATSHGWEKVNKSVTWARAHIPLGFNFPLGILGVWNR